VSPVISRAALCRGDDATARWGQRSALAARRLSLAKAPYAVLAQTCVIRDEIGAARWRGLFDKRSELRKHDAFGGVDRGLR
jgi:hypothetical protein